MKGWKTVCLRFTESAFSKFNGKRIRLALRSAGSSLAALMSLRRRKGEHLIHSIIHICYDGTNLSSNRLKCPPFTHAKKLLSNSSCCNMTHDGNLKHHQHDMMDAENWDASLITLLFVNYTWKHKSNSFQQLIWKYRPWRVKGNFH